MRTSRNIFWLKHSLLFLPLSFLFWGSGAALQVRSETSETLWMFFTSQSAKIDERLSPEIREQFENDDDAPLKSVDVDLNGDGRMEKFILSGALSISGGNQWLVFDPARGVSRGMIIGAIIFVYREADEGYPRLESYWKQGARMAVVFNYTYSNGRYVRVRSRSLTVPEIDEYFRNKPPLDLMEELTEIRDFRAGDRRR